MSTDNYSKTWTGKLKEGKSRKKWDENLNFGDASSGPSSEPSSGPSSGLHSGPSSGPAADEGKSTFAGSPPLSSSPATGGASPSAFSHQGAGRAQEGRWENKARAWGKALRFKAQSDALFGKGGNDGKGGNGGKGGKGGDRGQRPPLTPMQRRWRLMRRAVGFAVFTIFLIIVWLTSPLGEKPLTALVLRGANAALAPQGLSVSLGSLSGLWSGEIRLFGLKLNDKGGEWLDMDEAVLYPSWGSVVRTVAEGARSQQKLEVGDDPTGPGLVLLDVRRATLFNLTVSRLPELPPSPSAAPRKPEALRLLPEWLEIEVGELELVRLAVGKGAEQLFFNVHANAHIADAQMALRAGIFASPQKRALKGPPLPDILPGDVTRSMREIAAAAEKEGLQMAMSGQEAQPAEPISSLAPPPDARSDNDAASDSDAQAPGAQRQTDAQQSRVQSPSQSAGQQGGQQAGQSGGQVARQPGGQATAQQAGQQAGQMATPSGKADVQSAQGVINVIWDGEFVDARWHLRDTLLLPKWLTGVQRLWSRSRVQMHMATWPPDVKHPLQARIASRFGLTTVDLPEKVRASLFSAQALWDGSTLVIKDVDLQVPMRDPQVLLRGSLGFSRAGGPGAGMQLKVTNVGALARTLGLTALASQLDGAVDVGMAVGRGGRHSLWWTKPLPEPRGFVANDMPGFFISAVEADEATSPSELGAVETELAELDKLAVQPKQPGQPAQVEQPPAPQPKAAPAGLSSGGGFGSTVSDEELWQDARASHAPTALHAVLRVDSEALLLPGGKMDKVKLVLRGISMDSSTAPEGTMQRTSKGEANAEPEDAVTTAQTPVTPALNGNGDQDMADFSVKGLPRGMVGVLRFEAGSLFGMGDAKLYSRWMLGGLHGDADMFMGRFNEVQGNIPGLQLGGDMEMTYALPVQRLWPWLDGVLDLSVDNWNALSLLVKSPLKGAGMGVALQMESRLNEAKQPRQYLKAEVRAQQVDAKSFRVSDVRGKVESDHVHALADVLALSLSAASRRQSSPEGAPPVDMSLLKVDLQMGPGSGGPVQWQWGQCVLKVAGEDARFDANLRGSVQGLLEGVFNFRQRLLQIKKLEVSDSQSGRGGRLLSPLKVALTENGAMAPVDVAFLPQGRLRLSAALKRLDGSAPPAAAAPEVAPAPTTAQAVAPSAALPAAPSSAEGAPVGEPAGPGHPSGPTETSI